MNPRKSLSDINFRICEAVFWARVSGHPTILPLGVFQRSDDKIVYKFV